MKFLRSFFVVLICLVLNYESKAETSNARPEGADASSEVVVNVNRGVMKKISIAINISENLISRNFAPIKHDIETVMINDLESTSLFKGIPKNAFMQRLNGISAAPSFPVWKKIKAQYLLNTEVQVDEDGSLTISFVLYDVLSEAPAGTFKISGDVRDWRKMAHLTANNIYERIIGEKGYFETKLLYISINKNQKGQKIHRLAMMDQDGYNHKFLTSGLSVVLTPRLAPGGNECAYFTYREKIVNGRRIPVSASVYRYNLQTGKIELIADFKGMTYAPRYSPDGNLLIFSLSDRGASSIYTFNLQTKEIRRLTKGRCIDTSPCYSPDGKQIVFNSDRGGTQQLYVMNEDGSNIRRLTFSKGRYATPAWSPRGDWIAFTKFGAGGFYIGVVRPNGSGERMIASGHLVEGPTWSPNGRVILFTHQDYSKKEKIFSVDITGYNKREISTPFNGIDPEWSRNIRAS